MENLEIALSPCPNDTYLFHAWIEGKIGPPPRPYYADIEELNGWALEGRFPLIKLSFACFAEVLKSYELLPIGSALGFNCGPKLIAKAPFPLEEFKEKVVALPGRHTTAHLLTKRLLQEPRAKRFCLYHEIESLIERGDVDCGVIIHENRFTFEKKGFCQLLDLGERWERLYSAPLPLGGLAIKRSLPTNVKQEILSLLQQSLTYARTYPEASRPFVIKHSQEKDPRVVAEHIATYVNKETEALSPRALQAIGSLIGLSQPEKWLFT